MSVTVAIVAHAPLASALKSCALHVFGADERVENLLFAFDIAPDADVESEKAKIAEKLSGRADKLILTDVTGATPANIASSFLTHAHTRVLSGTNLPMVITAIGSQELPLEDLTNCVKQAGGSTIAQEITF